MENSPQSPDNDPDPKETKDNRKKKQKNAESLGVFAMGPEEARKPNESADDIWSKLTLTRRKSGVSEEARPLSELTIQKPEDESGMAGDVEVPPASEYVPEDEAPLDDLSDTEKRYVEREISISRSAGQDHEQEDDETQETDLAVAAIEFFRAKIVDEGQDADQAFAEVLDSLLHPDSDTGTDGTAPEREVPTNPNGYENERPLYNMSAVSTERSDPVRSRPRTRPGKPAVRSLSHIRPRATAILPQGTGMYRLNPMASGPGFPAQEYMRGYDEITLGNIPGAIVGYLIGRRRGRIKAEKDFKSVRKKMEKKVKEVEEDISMKEERIRSMTRERRTSSEPSEQKERPVLAVPPRRESEAEPVRRAAPIEANELHGKKLPPERIGHVIIAGGPGAKTESAGKDKKDTGSHAEVPSSRVATMNRSELLDLSEEISVDNTTLRHVYNSHLIGENGLRRLVYEHVRGGDVKGLLQREMLEHGTEYERDPQLRRRVEADKPAPAGNEGDEGLKELLKKSGMIDGDADDDGAKSLSKPRIERTIRETGHKTKQFRALDVAFASIILVLLALVVMLIMTRG